MVYSNSIREGLVLGYARAWDRARRALASRPGNSIVEGDFTPGDGRKEGFLGEGWV